MFTKKLLVVLLFVVALCARPNMQNPAPPPPQNTQTVAPHSMPHFILVQGYFQRTDNLQSQAATFRVDTRTGRAWIYTLRDVKANPAKGITAGRYAGSADIVEF